MDFTSLRELLRASGVVGAGGAGFPSYGKLSDQANTVLLNCAECEPLLTLHRQLLERHASEILTALETVTAAMSAQRAIVCVKAEYHGTVDAVRACLYAHPHLSLHTLDSVYPTGDEVILIYEATGRVLRPGGLPLEAGVVVFNVETMFNIHRAIQGQPVTDKLVTVTGAVHTPITLRAPLGTPLGELVACAGGATMPDAAYLVGGPMMGSLGSPAQPVTKTTNAVLVLPPDHTLVLGRSAALPLQLKRAASACCQCESCTDLCTRHALGHPIEPHLFMRAAANGDFRDTQVFINTLYCSGCGVCEQYACPQSLSPRTLIGAYKAGLRKAGIQPSSDCVAAPVSPLRAWRTVPEARLAARLGLTVYEHAAPLVEMPLDTARVHLPLSQHIGAPAVPIVQTGDHVEVGTLLARPADGLSTALHASIAGTVLDCNNKYIVLAQQ